MKGNNNKTENQLLVIFGATGDLNKRKLMPSLYALDVLNLLPEKLAIVGSGRTVLTDEEFRHSMIVAIREFSKEKDLSKVEAFASRLFYQTVNPSKVDDFQILNKRLESLREQLEIGSQNIIFYLSTPPSLYEIIPQGLAAAGLNNEEKGWKRLIVEKPFGYDLEGAEKLNTSLQKNWNEEQIFRIDHYLGKETVQNVMVTRFSNGIFEPLWNRNFIHHVEITSAENFGVGQRGGYYEGSGALRDMVQNHLLQLVSLIAMEPPASIDANAIRNETVKVLQSLRPISEDKVGSVAIRGQYVESQIQGAHIKGYREEAGVDPASKTETFAALKFYIDNWRWGGVPFYIRTGKHLPTKVTEAVIHFKPTPHHLFAQKGSCDTCNQLIIRIQPDEGILIRFAMKTPGAGFRVENVSMDFHYSDLSNVRIPDAYERLLLDSMTGDSTLYARIDAVMAAWKFIAPIQNAWKNNPEIPVYGYPAGSWGPDVADNLIEEPEMTWRHPCAALTSDENFCKL
ncbi:MAG: glucose-6-phosphate dehydrogenase [Bacteroidales bacterium]|nr:glucose-6-phosphate dehydrogenase [Bacteroidales bacterium]